MREVCRIGCVAEKNEPVRQLGRSLARARSEPIKHKRRGHTEEKGAEQIQVRAFDEIYRVGPTRTIEATRAAIPIAPAAFAPAEMLR